MRGRLTARHMILTGEILPLEKVKARE